MPGGRGPARSLRLAAMIAGEASAANARPLGILAPQVLRRIPLILTPWFTVLAVAAGAVLWRDRELDQTLGREQSSGVVELQAEIVERELEWAAFTILDLSRDLAVVEYLSGENRRDDVESEFRHFCAVNGVFDQVRLIDGEGTEIVRVNYDGRAAAVVPRAELQSKADRYYVERAWPLPWGAVYVSPFDLNVEHGEVEEPWKPVVRIATPCFDAAGEKTGLIVLNYLGAELLRRLARAAESTLGWCALVDDDGYFLEAPAGHVSWGFLFDEPPTFARAFPTAWERMASGEGQSFEMERGCFTFRRIAPSLGPSRRGDRIDLAVRALSMIPRAELYAGSRERLARMAWAGLAVAVLLGLTAWRLAYVAALRRLHEHKLAESEGRLRRLSSQLLDVQEAERRRLSRDLHDDIGQLATAMTIDLGRAQRLQDEAAKEELIERAQTGAAQLLESVRRVSASLRSSALEDLGFAGAVRQHLRDVEGRTGLAVDLTLDLDEDGPPPHVAIHLFRVIQEALANTLKHAGVERASLDVLVRDDVVELTVEDEGAGFDPDHEAEGVGLLGMRERIELLGGHFEVRSAPARGTRIRATVPLDARDARDESSTTRGNEVR